MSCLQDSAAEIEMTILEWYAILPDEMCWIKGLEKKWDREWVPEGGEQLTLFGVNG